MSDQATASMTAPLVERGAIAAGSPADALRGAGFLAHPERASEPGYDETDMAAIHRGVIKGDPS